MSSSTSPKVSRPNPKNIHRKPLVSVVIPAYKEEDRIEDTLYTLFRQSIFKDTEVIVVEYNPGNDPYLQNLLHGMAKCRYITVNRAGIAYARHVGIMSAMSPIICNFDADCEFTHKYCLANLIEPIQKKECILTVCDNMFDLTEVPIEKLNEMQAPTNVCNFLNNLQRTTPIACLEPASCFSKTAYQYVGGYDDTVQHELFHLNNRFIYHYNNISTFLFEGKLTGAHKKHIDDAGVIVSSRRAIKWAERGVQVLDYNNAYR